MSSFEEMQIVLMVLNDYHTIAVGTNKSNKKVTALSQR